jgi:CRP/FNR family transcriptional regulator, cyclic AMP receptor protein
MDSADARQITVRYAGPGYFLGAGVAEDERYRVLVPWGVQAITPARVLYLNRQRLRVAALDDGTVAWALLAQMGEYHRDMVHLLAGTAFGSIRQRVAMHLLNLAAGQEKGPLVAPVTQQSLADAVGTTRETVAGALAELRAAGLIATARGAVLLRDPEGLAAESARGSGVDQESL